MAIVLMPALSPTMTEGKLAKWLVSEGDQVSSGDVIVEIETDKALMEVESLDDGVIAKIAVLEGTEGVKVGTAIAEILGENEKSTIADNSSPPQEAPQTQPAPEEKEASAPPKAKEAGTSPEAGAEEKESPPTETPPPKSEAALKTRPVSDEKTERIFASPLARRLAIKKGVDLASMAGSGPHGRIIAADIENASPSQTSASSQGERGQIDTGERSTVIKNSSLRTVIASRLQQSMQEAPHFYLDIDIELDALLAARKSINANIGDSGKVTVNDMMIKCAAAALMKVPAANASWEGEQTRQWHHADIAVAVAIDGGLVTPIIWDAEKKSLLAISQQMADLAGRARQNKLKPAEFSGGSFTISNLGMYGITSFNAVINPPHGAILAVGAGREMPVVKDGEITIATILTATLSCDHRVVDGVVGAEWMAAFKTIVENPMLALI